MNHQPVCFHGFLVETGTEDTSPQEITNAPKNAMITPPQDKTSAGRGLRHTPPLFRSQSPTPQELATADARHGSILVIPISLQRQTKIIHIIYIYIMYVYNMERERERERERVL